MTESISEDDRERIRQRQGVIRVSRCVHEVLKRKVFNRSRLLGDIAYLQAKLSAWNDDNSHFGKAAKSLVIAVIAEAANDERLTNGAES